MKQKSKTQYVYHFTDGVTDGNGAMKDLLGGKGANLAEMMRVLFSQAIKIKKSCDIIHLQAWILKEWES